MKHDSTNIHTTMQEVAKSHVGVVYVLSNLSMPNIVKIGYSKFGGNYRAEKFYKNDTAVATPFKVEFEIKSNDARALESLVHEDLSHCRVNSRREFFKCPISEATNSILEIAGEANKQQPETAPTTVDLDLQDGGVFHMISACSTESVTHLEYAQAVQSMACDADLIIQQVMRNRKIKENWNKRLNNSIGQRAN